MKTVLYPGSFDPFTNGHYDLVCRAAQLFDKVIVAVAVNAGKSPMVSLEERRHLIELCCANLPSVEVVVIEGLLVDSLERYGVQALIKAGDVGSQSVYPLASKVALIPPLGKLEASGSPLISSLPLKSEITFPFLFFERKASCFSAVVPVMGWNQCA